jgi:LysR family transcriptional regulator, low CO2-responsive transcriptional regulator
MHVTLRQLRIFEAVARHHSISRAAAELHLTQPAVSMQVKQLEEQIGVPLLEQVGRRLFLTEAGKELRGHARGIDERIDALNAAMEQFRGLERGLLRLAVVSTANYFVPGLIAQFSQRHPGVRVALQVANRDEVLATLADNGTDLAITGRPPDNAGVVAQASTAAREPGSGTRAAVERHFAAQGLAVRAGCEIHTNEALKQAVRAGLGIGIVSAQTIELELQTGCLVVLPVEGFPIMRRWYVLHRNAKRLSAAALTFREMLLTEARSV